MELDPEKLNEILEVLRDNGVSSFSCPAFSCSLLPTIPDEEHIQSVNEAITKPKATIAKGIYGTPSLWPDGVPPKFPGAETS